uniref:Glutathione S-transferase n=1 Tax=Ditylenchus dipsaci TaxID=166011 RepID=A0A915EAH6_9BILA
MSKKSWWIRKKRKVFREKTPLGQLPILDINEGETVITQSGAIARFLANKYGLTYVDFFVADFLHSLQKLEPKIFTEHYAILIDYVNRVYGLPKIKEHIKNRKEQIP